MLGVKKGERKEMVRGNLFTYLTVLPSWLTSKKMTRNRDKVT